MISAPRHPFLVEWWSRSIVYGLVSSPLACSVHLP
jgi:hypothetical protein